MYLTFVTNLFIYIFVTNIALRDMLKPVETTTQNHIYFWAN